MNDPRQVAASIVGSVEWKSEVSGYCRCPGESVHTHSTGKKDCRVNVDGAPTIYCFHASCTAAVAEANRRLRSALNGAAWQITLPGGRVLRSGDLLQANGSVLPHEALPARAQAEGRDNGEQKILETLRVMAERFVPEMFERFRWPLAQIVEDSPLQVYERDGEDQFRTWLRIWPVHSHIWTGDVYSSGKPEYRTHFRSVADWDQIGSAMGNFTCGAAFKPGAYSRTNENCDGTRFLVVESDTLTKDQIGAVFAYMNGRLHFNLHAIIDTACKSLHGWFDAPRDRQTEARLKTALTVFGCDPKLFTYSQPVRVPGAFRDGKLQRIVWLKS